MVTPKLIAPGAPAPALPEFPKTFLDTKKMDGKKEEPKK
jgi:hypothetical protein